MNPTGQPTPTTPPVSPGYNPNEMVTLTGSKGTVKQVPRSELPTYGLPTDYISQADTYAKSVKAGSVTIDQIPEKYRSSALTTLQGQGYTAESKAVSDTKAKNAAATAQQGNDATSLISSTLQNYLNVPSSEKGATNIKNKIPIISKFIAPNATEYESGVKGEAPALGKIFGGTGSGLRITQAEINQWANWLPSVHKTDAQNRSDVQKLNTVIRGRFGKDASIDPQILSQFGLDANGSPTKTAVTNTNTPGKNSLGIPEADYLKMKQNNTPSSGKGASFQDVKNDAGSMIKNLPAGMAALGNIIAGPVLNPVDTITGNGQKVKQRDEQAKALVTGTVDSYKRTLGGGPQNAEYRARHPVETVANLLAPIGLASGEGETTPLLTAGTNVSKVARAADTAMPAIEGGSKVSTAGNVLKGASQRMADLFNSGGSKEYIARTTKGAVPQNKVLMDEGILAHPSETGRIQAATRSLDKFGSQLADTYKNSDRVFKGSSLGDTIATGLKDAGYDEKAVGLIKHYIAQQGSLNLDNLENLIPMDKAWNIARKLEKNPPKIIGTPESASAIRQLSQDTARIIRGQLAQKVEGSQPLAQKYSAVKDYFDNKLPDNPAGISVSGNGHGIFNAAVNAGKSVINPVLNGTYKVGSKLSPDAAMPAIERAPEAAPSATMTSSMPQIKSNIPSDVVDKVTTSKGAAQGTRLMRDMRSKNFDFTPTSKQAARDLVKSAGKKRYK